MQRWTWVTLVGVLLLPQTVHAAPPTAEFAAAQLEFAAEALRRAEAAYDVQDYALAGRLSAEAALDARLAWGMSDERAMRRAAADINGRAESLRRRAVQGTSAPVANALSLP